MNAINIQLTVRDKAAESIAAMHRAKGGLIVGSEAVGTVGF
jgi:hypothetical protein